MTSIKMNMPDHNKFYATEIYNVLALCETMVSNDSKVLAILYSVITSPLSVLFTFLNEVLYPDQNRIQTGYLASQ